ncbi:MAG TPA: amino acid adenylation domain-containing protein, partial [Candidatus Dormibacteraeota bacterium]|nr:amino acid adenylation domain-containing protein [Candidatus Dormibacteraeota bacterium]
MDRTRPPSFGEERLWFLDRLEPAAPTYNIPIALRLAGELRVRALRRAIADIVERHEPLRTVFRDAGGRPVALVRPPAAAARVAVIDLRPAASPETERRAGEILDRRSREPFDLAAGPLFRPTLLRLGPRHHWLHFGIHHIVFDAGSRSVLLRELAERYAAHAGGTGERPPPLSATYEDFAKRQRELVDTGALGSQLAFWTRELDGVPALALPTDRPRPRVQPRRAEHMDVTLPRETMDRFGALLARERATPFIGLLSLLQVLLHRRSGQEDFAVGIPISGRTRTDLEPLVGLFLNTLAIRAGVFGHQTFVELLRRVRERCLDAFSNAEAPFEQVVDRLRLPRDLSRAPVFQVLLVVQHAGEREPALPGLEVAAIPQGTGAAKFDLTVAVRLGRDGTAVTWEYCADLFDAGTIRELARQFEDLLEQVVADPHRAVTELALRDKAAPALGLRPAAARSLPVRSLIDSQARRAPDAPAAEHGGRRLTYRELLAGANRLARVLRAHGVGPDVPVAVCLDRSLESAVALLGVLEAGGAYLPLDSSHPDDRLRFMVGAGGARVLVTTAAHAGRLANSCPRVVLLDPDLAVPADQPQGDPGRPAAVAPDHLAYVLFTSGSTGRPKAVGMPHRVLDGLVGWQLAQPDVAPGARVPQLTTPVFDASLLEMLSTWASGGCLVVPPDEARLDPGLLLRFLAAEAIDRVFLPFVALRQLADSAARFGADGLRLGSVVTAGEQLRITREIAALCAALPGLTLTNQYGPTETHVVTAHALHGDPGSWPELAPIGTPVAAAEVYVLDPALRQAPDGVPGELYAGGPVLARGYLGRPDLTAERFLPDPFAARPGARMYRTGDRAVRRRDAMLQFLGRADDQAKIRGHRVEPGEVEAALERHPGIRAAAVRIWPHRGDPRLAAYVVPTAAPGPPADGVRAFLRRWLPEPMVPSALVELAELPLTPTGKVDRRALPEPEWGRQAGGSGSLVPPATPFERALAGIWRDLLRVADVGVDDDFFELGGHSLLTAQLQARLREAFAIELPVREVFDRPTIRELAPVVESLAGAGRPLPARIEASRGDARTVRASFAQEALWYQDQVSPHQSAYNLASAFRLRGDLRVDLLALAVDEVVRRQGSLRTTFEARDGELLQVVHPPAPAPLAVTDLSDRPPADREREARRLAVEEAARPFDLRAGPLFRVRLLRLGNRDHVLLTVVHHIVADGWSLGVLATDLSEAYAALVAARPARLAELPVQYADYSEWQRGWMSGENRERHVAFWRESLRGAPESAELPPDRPRGAAEQLAGTHRARRWPPSLHGRLRSVAQAGGASGFMALLATTAVLLGRYSGQRDVVVGVPMANRDSDQTRSLIGLLVNVLPVPVHLGGGPTFRELLAAVREAVLAALAHQALPFELLVQELRPVRSPGHTPLFQVTAQLLALPDGELRVPGVEVAGEGLPAGATPFELALTFVELPDGGLEARAGYRTGLYEADTIERLLAGLEALAEAIVADPDRPVDELATPPAVDAVLAAPASAVGTAGQTLVDLFGERVAAAPDAVALLGGDLAVTYRELDRRSAALAHRLAAAGVTSESIVAVHLERSIEMVVALVAALRAGAAFLPLDPALPDELRAWMLADAAPAAIVGGADLARRLPPGAPPVLVEEPAALLEEPARSGPWPDSPAYVLYTSGSTGRPKGVIGTHRATVSRLRWMWADHPFRPGEVASHRTSPAFVDAVAELFGPLLAGTPTAIVPDDRAWDPAALVRALEVVGATRLVAVPSTLGTLADTVPDLGRRLAGLRVLVSSGEPLTAELAARLAAELPSCRVLNLYGSSEVAGDVSGFDASGLAPPVGRVPIGNPIAGARLLVLDDGMRPVPRGGIGELYVGGESLARGYLGRPGHTAERFVPDPFGAAPGERLYRTGDLARQRPDGALELCGRRDAQVKVRGFRIEPEHVEAALRQHPQVADCAVTAPGAGHDGVLVAHVVAASPDAPPAPESLRAHLSDHLPHYMVPALYRMLAELPRTRSGKVDRRSLPEPDRADDVGAYLPPADADERALCAVFGEVLDVPRVGSADDFFALGGHSLQAARLAARASAALGVDVSVRQVVEHRTPAALARAARRAHPAGAAASAP